MLIDRIRKGVHFTTAKVLIVLFLSAVALSIFAFFDIFASSYVIENASGKDLSQVHTFLDIGDRCRHECPENSQFSVARFTTMPYKIECLSFQEGTKTHQIKFDSSIIVNPYERIRILIKPDFTVTVQRSKSIFAQIFPLPRETDFIGKGSSLKVRNMADDSAK
ncbi:MAG TPA: hypothetical protein PKD05_03980 [Candidatus Melainabacteria bacterium]|nr:hypothetical protein [Candidatus Melainabacteria bacterium]HMP50690.1 hypothetical protein [Candidatus Melainabacteria bacterium]